MQGDAVDSRSVWMLETIAIVDGGPVQWKAEHCRFKNVYSGLYLCAKKTKSVVEDGNTVDKYILMTTRDSAKSGTQFHFFESNTNSKYLNMGKALQIASGSQWLARGEHFGLDFQLKTTGEKADAVSLLINGYVPFTLEGDEMAKEPLDLNTSLSIRRYMQKYLNMTEIPQNRSINTLWPSAERNDVAFFQEVIAKCRNFTQGFMLSSDTITLVFDWICQLLK